MRVRVLRAAAFACLALPLALPVQAQSVLLRLSPENGLTSRYAMAMEMYMDAPMMSSDEPFMLMDMYSTQTVTGVDGEIFEYTTVTDSANVETPAMPMMQQQMPDLTGETQIMRMDSRGRLVDMQMESMPEEAQQFVNQMGGFGMELPEGEVSPGDSWTASIDFGAPGVPGGQMQMLMELTYTLVEYSSGVATITYEGPITMSGEAEGMGMEANGTATGAISIDLDAGRLVSSEMAMAMDMTAAGMAMSMNQSMTMMLLDN